MRKAYVNTTDDHFFSTPDCRWHNELVLALKKVTTLNDDVRRGLNSRKSEHFYSEKLSEMLEATKLIVAAHDKGRVTLTPRVFTTGNEFHVPHQIASQMLQISTLGRSIQAYLTKHGLLTFIERQTASSNRANYRKRLDLIVASLCMSITGVENAEEITPELFMNWQGFFRLESASRWNSDLWAEEALDVTYQCLKEVCLAYSRATGNQEVAQNSRQKRSDAKNLTYWDDFQKNVPVHIKPWLDFFLSWRALRPTHSLAYRQTFMHLARWLTLNYDPKNVENVLTFLTTQEREPSFKDFMLGRLDEEDGQGLNALITYLSYAENFSDFLCTRLGVTIFPIATESDIEFVKNEAQGQGKKHRPSEAVSRPLPRRYYLLAKEILSEGKDGWPGRDSSCRVLLPGRLEPVYCPTLPTLFLSLFHLPLRVGQMKRLDSGEGDVRRFDGGTQIWSENKGSMAGYWKRVRNDKTEHGYATAFDGERQLVGFQINTNKTGKPYRIPWQNEELHQLLYALRCWQEENLPCLIPVKPADYVDNIDRAEEGKLDDYPDIFPLFRLPGDSRSGRQGLPPNSRRTNEFWQRLLVEVERRWNENNPDQTVQLVKRQEKTGQAYGGFYNPHGLRVAGLTLMLHQKVPIEIISKMIAGHKTVLMTLYYMKLDPGAIHEALEKALENRNEMEVSQHFRELKSAAIEHAQMKSAFISQDGIAAAVGMQPRDQVLWADTGIGFCPYDGERCHDGGKLLRKDQRPNGSVHNVHAPVEGGERNCVLCRHFVTGVAWRAPLWLYGNKLLRQLADKSQRISYLQLRLEELRLSAVNNPDGSKKLLNEITQYEIELHALTEEQELIGRALWNTIRLLEACDKIDTGGQKGTVESSEQALVYGAGIPTVTFSEVPDFVQAAMITAAARVYPVLYDAEAEASRNHFIDAIVWNAGGQPLSLSPLAPDARRRGQDAMSRLLMARVKHQELESLKAGAIRLQDLDLDGDVSEAVTLAIGQPFRFGPAGDKPFLPGPTQ